MDGGQEGGREGGKEGGRDGWRAGGREEIGKHHEEDQNHIMKILHLVSWWVCCRSQPHSRGPCRARAQWLVLFCWCLLVGTGPLV